MKIILNRIYRTIAIAVTVLCLLFIILWAFDIVTVVRGHGPSMLPNYRDGEHHWMVRTENYECGDVVGIEVDDKLIMKRIVACPGDELLIGYSNIWINHKIYPENYISYENEGWNDFGEYDVEITLGDDEYYIMGDNRKDSEDSRHFGPIKKEQIKGLIIR